MLKPKCKIMIVKVEVQAQSLWRKEQIIQVFITQIQARYLDMKKIAKVVQFNPIHVFKSKF